MKYPFISILPLIDEVRNHLRIISKTSQFTDEDIYGWMIDAARLIQNAAYESHPLMLEVKKHIAILPKDFYLLDDITKCINTEHRDIVAPVPINAAHNEGRNIYSAVMRPADSASRRYCSSRCGDHRSDLTYTVHCPPGIIRTSFYSGWISIAYERLKTGEDGGVMIQDEPNSIEALKAYVKMNLLQEKYIMQQIPRYIYKDFEDTWEDYCFKARGNLKFPSQNETRFRALEQDARFRLFSYRR